MQYKVDLGSEGSVLPPSELMGCPPHSTRSNFSKWFARNSLLVLC